MDDENKDVIEEGSSTPELDSDGNPVEGDKSDDKDENLKKIREENRRLKEENERLKTGSGQGTDKPETVKILFDRDLKKATNRWNKENKVSSEIWDKVRGKVSLKGDEDDEEIYDRFSEAYESLPEVKAMREKDLLEKGKAEGRREFTDDEMDLGTGGGEPSGTENNPKFTRKEQKVLDSFGVSQEARKKIKK